MKCSKGYAGGDVQPEFIWIYHLRAALAPGSSRREAQQLQVIHRARRGGPLLIIGGWIVQAEALLLAATALSQVVAGEV